MFKALRGWLPLTLVLFAGCSRGPDPDKITLTIWSSPTGGDEKNFLKLCARFEAEHTGIVIHNVGGLQEPKLVRALVAGAPPDLIYMYNPTLVGPLAGNDALQPLDARFRQASFQTQDFLPGAIDQLRYGGILYAMPVCRDSRGFYWNRAVFKKEGLNADRPPETMEELFQLATRLTIKRSDGTLKRLGMLPPADSSLFFCAMGGRLYDEASRRITLNCPENIAALEWLVRLVDAEGGHDKVAAFQSGFGKVESAQNPLALGHVVMQIDGEWIPAQLEKYAPFADYGVGEIPHPAARPDLKNMAWQDGDVMMLPRGSRHPDLAWEFMRWLQEPRQQEEYSAALGNLPTVRALLASPRLTQGSRSKEALGYIMQHISSNAANARFFPSLPVTKLYKDALDNAVQQAELHRKSPEQALTDAQNRVQREMDKYNR
jgi:multiple sugar transport system substrate-binding protein